MLPWRQIPPVLVRPRERVLAVFSDTVEIGVHAIYPSLLVANIRGLFEWLGERGGAVLLAALLIVGGTWGFVELLGEVREGDTRGFDEYVLHAIGGSRGPAWLAEMGRDITALGGVTVLTIITGEFSLAAQHGAEDLGWRSIASSSVQASKRSGAAGQTDSRAFPLVPC